MIAADQDFVNTSVSAIELDRFFLSTRTRNLIINAEIKTIGELAALRATDILRWRQAGRKTLRELQELLGRLGLKFSDDTGAPPPPDPALMHYLSIVHPAPISHSPPVTTTAIELKNVDADTQRRLVKRVKALDLSNRAQGVLQRARINFLGELVQLHHHEIIGFRNSGRKTANELAAVVRGHGFALGIKISDWSRSTALTLESTLSGIIAKETRISSREFLASIAPQPRCLEDELNRIVQALCSHRNAEILSKLWGCNGESDRTLASVGEAYRITRERVRQIEARALRKLKDHKFETPFLRSAIEVLRNEVPGVDSDLGGKIREQGVSRSDFSVWSLKRAAENFEVRWPFERVDVNGKKLLVSEDDGPLLSGLMIALRRKTSELGCANIGSLASELRIDQGRSAIISRILESSPFVEWLDETHEWLYSKEAARNRLYNIASKVLGVCPRIRISELRRAAGKSKRLPMTPPQRILAAFVERTGLGRVEAETVVANPGVGVPPTEDSAEGRMLSVLDTHGPIMDGEDFANKCVASGINATTFYIYRANSSVISALGKGVYCKIGCEVPPGTIEDIVARRKTVTRVSDHGWTPNGRLWFGVELTRQVIVAGGLRMPSFVSDLVQGEWKLSLPDGSDCSDVNCREVFIWSFRKAFAVLGAEPGDLSVLEFDLKARSVVVRVGGPGLFEAIQETGAMDADEVPDEF